MPHSRQARLGKTWYVAFFLCFVALSGKGVQGQDFRSPLDIPLALTGTFGELRSNHFHAGLDIATEGVTGLPVYACAEGYVSRIVVSPWGYGKALYITHPNGLTTVYGHLSGFEGRISAYVEAEQMASESWALDVRPDTAELRITKGSVVARSGNSGGSGGPHLHFEVRRGDTPLNPLQFGFQVADHRAPELRTLYCYPLWDEVPDQEPLRITLYRKGDTWSPAGGVVRCPGQRIGFGLDAFDRQDSRNNRNGIYSASLNVDGQARWAFRFDSLSFADKRYCNAHLDYRESAEKGAKVHRFFKLPGNQLDVYESHPGSGMIDGGYADSGRDARYDVRIELRDFAGNKSRVVFTLISDPRQGPSVPESDTLLPWFRANSLRSDSFYVNIPARSLYDNAFFPWQFKGTGPYSGRWQFGHDGLPLHKPATIALQAKKLPPRLANKALLIRVNRRGRERALQAHWENGFVSASSDKLGSFYVDVDTVPPSIRPRGWYQDQRLSRTMRFTVKDDRSGIASFRGTIDGEWVPFDYDPKQALLVFERVADLEPGKHEVVLVVQDVTGNESELRLRFGR